MKKKYSAIFTMLLLSVLPVTAQDQQSPFYNLIVGTWSQTMLESFDSDGRLTDTETYDSTFVSFFADTTCIGLLSFNGGLIVPTCPFVIQDSILTITSPFVLKFRIMAIDDRNLTTRTDNLTGNGQYSICHYSRVEETTVGRIGENGKDSPRYDLYGRPAGAAGFYIQNGRKYHVLE